MAKSKHDVKAYQHVGDLVDTLASHVNTIYLKNLITFMQ